MATPLADLLNGLRSDTGMRAEFELSPADFLDAHGWGSLETIDLQEACYVMADGAPSDDAARWLAGGEAIGDGEGDAAGALVTALAAVAPATFGLDPAELDDLDEPDEPDELGADEADDADDGTDPDPGVDEPGPGTSVESGTARSVESDAVTGDAIDAIDAIDDASSAQAEFDLGGEPEGFLDDHAVLSESLLPDSLLTDPEVGAREAGDFGDDWDELI